MCAIDDLPARVVVNWTIVRLCLEGRAPASKREIRQGLARLAVPRRAARGIDAALAAHHEGRFLTWPEARRARAAYDWLWSRLNARLGLSQTEEYVRYREFLERPPAAKP